MPKPRIYTRMTWQERRDLRSTYSLAQDGKCYYCGGELSEPPPKMITDKPIDWRRFPPHFLRHPHHLHHDHNTGLTIGTVHAYCNAVLWQYHGE